MLRQILRQLGVVRTTVLISAASVLISIAIVLPTKLYVSGELELSSIVLTVLVPAITAPLFGGVTVMLAYRLDAAQVDMQRMAITDELTQVANRRYFFEELRRESARTQRYGGDFSLVLLDVDDFKKINDVHGHLVGDEVLCALTRMCKQQCRDSDTFARFGGEEFVFILPHTAIEGAVLVAERVRQCVASTSVMAGGSIIRVTASVGVAAFDPGATDVQEVVARADAALYRAKHAGKDRVVAGAASTS
ncbi:MAG: GGDEF domain-containing protein [Myxococcota bacterium]